MEALVKNLTNLTAAKLDNGFLCKIYKINKKFDKNFVQFNYDFSLDKNENL